MIQKITPFLWFDGQAEEAANFYVSVFKNSFIKKVVNYKAGSPGSGRISNDGSIYPGRP